MAKPAKDSGPSGNRGFRWDNLFRNSPDPIFLLNHQRRVRYVNPAWKLLVGLSDEDAIGLHCRPNKTATDTLERLGAALAPPADMLHQFGRSVRRANPLGIDDPEQPRWWDVAFFPIKLDEQRKAVIGIIQTVDVGQTFAQEPLPENLVAIRERYAEHFQWQPSTPNDSALRRIHEQIRLAAHTDMPITIVGNPGTGKSYLARVIHHSSDRRDEAFVSLHCAKLPAAYLDQLLFNDRCQTHLGRGTLLLKEPAALAREQQHQLAQLITSKMAVPRIACSMTVSPKDDGRLLPELFAIVAPMTIELPELKQRRSDFVDLCNRLLRRACQAAETESVRSLSTETLDLLRRYAWPGNLPELSGVLFAACRRTKSDQIQPDDLPFFLRTDQLPGNDALPLDALLEKVERRLITLALQLARNNKTKAAEILSIWRPRLLRRMEALDIADDSKEKPNET